MRGRLYLPNLHCELHHRICHLRYGTHGYGMSVYIGFGRRFHFDEQFNAGSISSQKSQCRSMCWSKNEKHVKLKKNIGRIFRQYNIIEYKSPEDGSGTGRQRHILPHRDAIPIQLVIVQKLSKEHNYWLNNLRNDLKAGSEIKKNYRVVKKQNYSYQMSIIKN